MALVNLTDIQATDWTMLEDDAAPKTGATVAVPLARLVHEEEAFFTTAHKVGAVVETGTDYRTLAPLANKLAFVAIHFPAFGDGRGFSLAVRLRKDLGFTGEIRAIGHVIPDQAIHLLRSGFDTVEIADKRKDALEAALKRYDIFYQSDFTGRTSLAHTRHSARAKASDETKDKERKAS